MLLDPLTGAVRPCAPDVIHDCADPVGVVAESMRFLVETRTPVCRTLDDVGRSIRQHRRIVAGAARAHGAISVATGVPPYGLPPATLLTDAPRYRALARRFPAAMHAAGVCGCHVHVAVPSREVGVRALARIRPWLPALTAVAASSPVWNGRDSGWGSFRFVLVSRWPTAVPPPAVRTPGEYDEHVHPAVAAGAALDVRSVYYLARLSPRYPTIEVRVGDVALTAAEAVCYAGLVRALVMTALREGDVDAPPSVATDQDLVRACRRSARSGLVGNRSWRLADDLIAHVAGCLRAAGDEDAVLAHLARLRASGSGATRQRRLLRVSDRPQHFLAALARETVTGAGDG